MQFHLLIFLMISYNCDSYRILAIFPYNGRSHHILFSSFVEELAARKHEVTVINYFPVKKMANLRQISIQDESDGHCNINMEDNLNSIPLSIFINFYRAYDMLVAFKEMADDNCNRLMTHTDIRKIATSGDKYDLVIAEQFVTDCGLALAFKLNAPVIGMTAHVLMPWTYSRLGASNNPAFVPNHMFATRSPPTLWEKIQSIIINLSANAYYRYVIQKSNQRIVNNFYPEIPDLENLGRNMSLIMLNQYFPLTGARLHGTNIIEVGGMHVNEDNKIIDKELKDFLDSAENGVVYISFGSVAHSFPPEILKEIMFFVKNVDMKFVWKVDNITNDAVPKNLLMKKWLPQPAILCHPKVLAFITHSGMLSTTEAMHCGVPIIAVPLFGDQFSNAAAAEENGLGVALDIYTLNKNMLDDALQTVLQDRYQTKAKELSQLWKDRPLSAMDTAVFWTEYVAKYHGKVNLKPPTVNINIFEYFLVDIFLIFGIILLVVVFITIKLFSFGIKLNVVSTKKKNE